MIGNQIKTVVLLGLLTGIFLWVGSLWGQSGLTIALIFSIVMNFGSYWFSDKIILKMYRAKEIGESDNPLLFNTVKDVAHLAKLPMPKVYVVPSDSPNAFATGRDPKHAAVAATRGILRILDKNELRGVMAHELSHVRNRDTLIASIAATIAGVISYVAFIARWGAIFGGYGGRDRDGNNMLEFLVLAILTPLLATIIRLAISRSREYMADESAAKIVHDSEGLSNALRKLESNVHHNPLRFGSKTTSSLFIVNPFSGSSFLKLFSTHPSTDERVKRLLKVKL